MNTLETLDKIRAAKRSHVTWVKRTRALIDGLPVDQEKVPVLPTECIFGQWYYGDGKNLSKLETFKAIENTHNQLHNTDADIFKLLFENNKPSLLKRMLGVSAKPKQQNIDAANILFLELQTMSDVIVTKLEALEGSIKQRQTD